MSGMLNQAIEDMNTTVQKLESARARLDSLRKNTPKIKLLWKAQLQTLKMSI